MTRLRTLFSAAQKKATDRDHRKYYSKDVYYSESSDLTPNTTTSKIFALVKYKYLAFAYFASENNSNSMVVSLEDINEKLSANQNEVSNLLVRIASILFQISPILSYRAAKRMIEVFKKKYNIQEDIKASDLYDTAKLQSLMNSVVTAEVGKAEVGKAEIGTAGTGTAEIVKTESPDSERVNIEKRLEALRDINSIKDFINYYVQRDLYAMYRRILYNIIYRNAFAYTNNLDKSKNRIGALLEFLHDYGFYPLGRGGLGYTIDINKLSGIKQSYSDEEKNSDLETFNSFSTPEQRFIIMVLGEIIRLFSEILVIEGRNPNPNPYIIKDYYIFEYTILKDLIEPNSKEKIYDKSLEEQLQEVADNALSVHENISNLLTKIFSKDLTETFLELYPVVCWLARTELQVYMGELGKDLTKQESGKVIHDPNDRIRNMARLRNASHFLSNYDVLGRSVEQKTNTMIKDYLVELENQSSNDILKYIVSLADYLYELYSKYNVVLTSPFIYDAISGSDFIKEIKTANRDDGYLPIAQSSIPKNLLIPVLFYESERKTNLGEVKDSVKVYRNDIILKDNPANLYEQVSSNTNINEYLLLELKQMSSTAEAKGEGSAELKKKLLQGFIVNALASMENSSYIILVPTFVLPVYIDTINIPLGADKGYMTSEKAFVQGADINKVITYYVNLGIELNNDLKIDEGKFLEIDSMQKGGDIFVYDTQNLANKISIESMQANLFVTR